MFSGKIVFLFDYPYESCCHVLQSNNLSQLLSKRKKRIQDIIMKKVRKMWFLLNLILRKVDGRSRTNHFESFFSEFAPLFSCDKENKNLVHFQL